MEKLELLRNVHSNEQLLKSFQKGHEINRGSFGDVFKVNDDNGHPIAAMKLIKLHLDRSVLMGVKGKEEKSVIEVSN